MSGMNWFVIIDGSRHGPMTADAVANLLNRGRIDASTLVWRDGMGAWQQLNSVEQFSTLASNDSPNAEKPSAINPFESANAPGKHASQLSRRLVLCLVSFSLVTLCIFVFFAIDSVSRFMVVFVFNPSAIAFSVGLCISFPLIVFDRMILGIVPMIQSVLLRDKQSCLEESRLFRMMMSTISMNAVSVGALGFLLGLAAVICCDEQDSKITIMFYMYNSMDLVYGLLIATIVLLLLFVQSKVVKDKGTASGHHIYGELSVIVPIVLLFLFVLLNFYVRK